MVKLVWSGVALIPALLSKKSICVSAPKLFEKFPPNLLIDSWDPVSHSRMWIDEFWLCTALRDVRSLERDRTAAMIVFEESVAS